MQGLAFGHCARKSLSQIAAILLAIDDRYARRQRLEGR